MRLHAYFENAYIIEVGKGALRGERSAPAKRDAVKLFVGLLGNKRLFDISSNDIWAFHTQLLDLPDRRRLSALHRARSLPELVAMSRSGDIKSVLMSPKTINKHLTAIRTVLQHAVSRRDINLNVATDVRARVPEEDETGRAFLTDELNRIVGLPLFAGCMEGKSDGGLFKAGPVKVRDDRFWIPLLLLFSGARSSEIVGLSTSDIFPDHEIPHILIQPNELRLLKNKHSKRMVPLHPILMQAGFLSFARGRLATDDARLFPMAEQLSYRDGATGELKAKALSSCLIMRQFNRTHLAHAKANQNSGSIKCFRNTFEQEALARVESDEIRRRLTGRDVRSTVSIYTQNIPTDPFKRTDQLQRLDKAMRTIEYRGVDFSPLFSECSR
jgi:integrase